MKWDPFVGQLVSWEQAQLIYRGTWDHAATQQYWHQLAGPAPGMGMMGREGPTTLQNPGTQQVAREIGGQAGLAVESRLADRPMAEGRGVTGALSAMVQGRESAIGLTTILMATPEAWRTAERHSALGAVVGAVVHPGTLSVDD